LGADKAFVTLLAAAAENPSDDDVISEDGR